MIPPALYEQAAMLCVGSSKTAPTAAEAVGVLQDRGAYVFEIKLDGIRCTAFIDDGKVQLRTRTGEDLNKRYPEVVERLVEIYAKRTIVLDGELVVMGDNGLPDFNRSQKRSSQSTPAKIAAVRLSHPASFVVFDVLYNGDDLRRVALKGRQALLQAESARFGTDPRVQVSVASPDGRAMWEFVKANRLEGLIAKHREGSYTGLRDPGWIKLKDCLRVTVIVTGFEFGKGARASKVGALFMSLLDDNGDLAPVGRVGTGFKEADHGPLLEVLRLGTPTKTGSTLGPDQQFLVEVECMPPTTGDMQLRFPSFKGVRTDVTRDECTLKQLS
jgi:ATP-dependent DNA ligase